MSRSVRVSSVLTLFALGAASLPALAEPPRKVGDPRFADAALAAVEAYHRLDADDLEPRLGEGFRYVERKTGQDLDGPAFLAMVPAQDANYRDRSAEIGWVGVIPTGERRAEVEVRGRWRATAVQSERDLDLAFSTRLGLELDTAHQVRLVSWTDVYSSRRLFRRVVGDGKYLSDHFEVRFLSAEFDEEGAAKLAALAESWYEQTAEYLGRRLEKGRRVTFDIASVHGVPYASAPGPDAFFLIGLEHARRDYGFSLVHELTHNLMGLSRLSDTTEDQYRDGNRLFDEGFGVYVEERLVEDGSVFPNFGREIHGAYLQLHEQMEIPRPPILEAEGLRRAGGDKTRLGYLQQASFVKWLVDTAPGPSTTDGLARFQKLFDQGLEVLPELYGRDMTQLEKEWLAFLEGLS